MAEAIIYLNGDRVPESKAGLKVFDAGIVLGATTTEMTRTFGLELSESVLSNYSPVIYNYQPFRILLKVNGIITFCVS